MLSNEEENAGMDRDAQDKRRERSSPVPVSGLPPTDGPDDIPLTPAGAITEDLKLPEGSAVFQIVRTIVDGQQHLDMRGVLIGTMQFDHSNPAHRLLATIQNNVPELIQMATGQQVFEKPDEEIEAGILANQPGATDPADLAKGYGAGEAMAKKIADLAKGYGSGNKFEPDGLVTDGVDARTHDFNDAQQANQKVQGQPEWPFGTVGRSFSSESLGSLKGSADLNSAEHPAMGHPAPEKNRGYGDGSKKSPDHGLEGRTVEERGLGAIRGKHHED